MAAGQYVKAYPSLLHSHLSDRAIRLFLLAKEHVWRSGAAPWTHADMAQALHCSVSSARRAERELREAGLIGVEAAAPGQANEITVPESVQEAKERKGAARAAPLTLQPSPLKEKAGKSADLSSASGSARRPAASPCPPDKLQLIREQGGSPRTASHCSPADSASIHADAYRCTTTTPDCSVGPEKPSPAETDPVVVALQNAGIDPWTAGWLHRQYGADRCQKGLALLAREKNVEKPGAWLRRAIERDFAIPAAQTRPRAPITRRSPEQIAADEAEAAAAKAAREAHERHVLADIAARKERGEDWVGAYA